MTSQADERRFMDLLEKPDRLMTDADWLELGRLERALHERDVDAAIRSGFRELERTGELRRYH